MDRRGLLRLVNRQTELLFGYDRGELLGQPVEVLLPEHHREVHAGHRKGYFDDPRTRPMGFGLNLAGRRSDGTEFPVDISLSAVPFTEGTIVIAAVRDMTERKKADEAVALLAAVVASSEDAIFRTDPEGRILSWNAAATHLYGYEADEILGLSVSTLAPPERLDEIRSLLERLKCGERIARFETVRIHKDGTKFHVSLTLSPVYDQHGNRIGAATIAHDVTEQRRIQEALRESEQRFRQIFDEGPLGIALVDSDLQITNVNHALCRFIEGTGKDLIGRTVESFIHPDDSHGVARLARQLFAGTIPGYQSESRFLTLDDDVVVGSVTASVIAGDSGESAYGLLIIEDIAERKQLEQELVLHASTASKLLASLTHRETEVLELLGETGTATQIAKSLNVSVRTVEFHLANAYKKLGVRTKATAIAEFSRLNRTASSLMDASPQLLKESVHDAGAT